jgi:7-cyano-7-deazaguanine synthase in queuosine biosynthesis
MARCGKYGAPGTPTDSLMNAHLVASSAAPAELCVGKNVSVGSKTLESRYRALTSLETDFLNVAAVIYAADLAVKRDPREDFIRTIELDLPVVNLSVFNSGRAKLEQILRVLSCDNWTLRFKGASGTPESNRNWPNVGGTTLLFSGGLDSFAEACDLVGKDEDLTLVSHATHNQPVAGSQANLVARLEKHFKKSLSHIPVMVFCRRQRDFPFPQEREDTQRTRSFLFVALAAIAARMNGSRRILVMAENGQFAIHLPLTAARAGAFSTHTAHPEFLALMQRALRELLSCPDLSISNPFEYLTKAEVVQLVPTKLRPAIEDSISCWMTARLTTHTHCGECIPCLSRRLALEAHKLSFKEYKRDMFREDVVHLPPDDNGKRNLTDLLEFIARFHGPDAVKNEQDLSFEFPELINPFVNPSQAIRMYRRFAKSATDVLRNYPKVGGLLK